MRSNLACLLLLLLSACEQEGPSYRYLFLGHPYDWESPVRVDPRVEMLSLDPYAGVWLGGDVCGLSSQEASTLAYIDGLFDLSHPRNHWAWGNHDIIGGHEDRIREATRRPSYYVHWQEGLCLVVLNTNLFWHYPWNPPRIDCERRHEQLEMLRRLRDTLQSASHLLILHHHALFNEFRITAEGDTLIAGNTNAIPIRTGCDSLYNVTGTIYPWLVDIRERGIPVIMVGGDFGMNRKQFSQLTPEGIWMLGAGITNSLDRDNPPAYVTNTRPDSVIVFTHRPLERQLDWTFVRLGDLLHSQWGKEGPPSDLSPELLELIKDY